MPGREVKRRGGTGAAEEAREAEEWCRRTRRSIKGTQMRMRAGAAEAVKRLQHAKNRPSASLAGGAPQRVSTRR